MDLNEVLVFTKVVQAGSFVAAGRELAMPKSTVSRKITELEQRLGARLLQRTTRTLSLTDVGRTFYEHAARIVGELEEAELAVGRLQQVPRGALRVTAPLNFGFLTGVVASFLLRYPEVELELVCTDRVVDLVADGFDLAIRAGKLADSTLVARRLGVLRSYLVASPDYLDRRGRPSDPSELERFDCIVFGPGTDRSSWTLSRAGRRVSANVASRLVVNDFDFVDAAAEAGLGIAMVPVHRCIAALRERRLERVLPEWTSPETPVHGVYPSSRHLSPKVKAFLDHLGEQMTPPPWERGPTA